MCGRARCTLNPAQVAQACGLSDGDAASVPTVQMNSYHPSFNVMPGFNLPVFVMRKEGSGPEEKKEAPVIHCMKWGLVPSFTNKTEKPNHFRMFNARSESIKEKASFRRLIPTNRCLVAAEGFYEWKKDGSRKQPYYIHLKDDRPLVFAALYDYWSNSEGEILYTFTILTARCSSSLEWLHDRMPVILGNQSSIDMWLSNSTPKFEIVLVPYEEPDLVWYPVSPAMGKSSFDGPEWIKEIQLKSAVETPLLKFFSKKIDGKGQSKRLIEEFSGTDASDCVKEKAAAEETEEDNREVKSSNSDAFMLVQERTAEPDMRSTKRESEKVVSGSGLMDDKFDSFSPGPLKKKVRSLKNVGDRQASLFSYFERS